MRNTALLIASLAAIAACAHDPGTGSGAATPGTPATDCASAVTASIGRTFPGATITSCKAEHEDGHDQYEVKLDKGGGDKLEVDVAQDGTVLQTEQVVPLDRLPAPVAAAFGAKYPSAKPTRAEKQVRTGKGTFYEIAFPAEPKRKEATFAEDGTFVEEE